MKKVIFSIEVARAAVVLVCLLVAFVALAWDFYDCLRLLGGHPLTEPHWLKTISSVTAICIFCRIVWLAVTGRDGGREA